VGVLAVWRSRLGREGTECLLACRWVHSARNFHLLLRRINNLRELSGEQEGGHRAGLTENGTAVWKPVYGGGIYTERARPDLRAGIGIAANQQ
jgi:hypothetical protein